MSKQYDISTDSWQTGYEEWKKVLEGTGKSTGAETPVLEKPPCYVHRPVRYVGFTETYDYCEVCDAKLKDGKWQK